MGEVTEGTEEKNQFSDLDYDPVALRDRYREEREKRLRADGNDQYVEVIGEFARFLDDPYPDEAIERESLHDDVDIQKMEITTEFVPEGQPPVGRSVWFETLR